MPFSLVSRLPSRSRKLYFPPGGHTHDRHTIPPDRLHVSLSDPVLVAAEEKLSNWIEPSITKDPESSGHDDGYFSLSAANHPKVTQGTSPGRKTTAQDPSRPDSSGDSCDIVEVMSMSLIDVSLASADGSASEIREHGPDLAPLASEMFKEELYVRGYLKRPASQSTNVVPRKSRTSLTLIGRKVLPKVLGRRQGRKVAERLRTEQVKPMGVSTDDGADRFQPKGAAKTPIGPSAHRPEKHISSVASVTLRVPRSDGLESPGMDTTISASESFDLHAFSYITAFTTPPCSPSIVEMLQDVHLGECKHAL